MGSAHVDAEKLSRKSYQFKYVATDKGITKSNKFSQLLINSLAY